jgi:hypothetical protein
MASSPQRNHAFIYDRKNASRSHYNKSYVHTADNNSHDMFASSSTFVYGRSRPRRNHVVPHVPRRMCNEPTTVFHSCNTSFVLSCKNEKVVASKLGFKCKGDKTCIWVPKAIVTNLVGPNKSCVGTMLRRRRSCRKKQLRLKLSACDDRRFLFMKLQNYKPT